MKLSGKMAFMMARVWASMASASINDYGSGVYGGGRYRDRQKWSNVPNKRKNRRRHK